MRGALLLACALGVVLSAHAAEHDFEIPDDSSTPGLVLSGNLDARYALTQPRPDSPLNALQYPGQESFEVLSGYRMDLYLNGDYQAGEMGMHLKTLIGYREGAQTVLDLHEIYGNVGLAEHSYFALGKKRYAWGKGYAFNPVGYVNPQKEPDNPELSQAGTLSMNYQYTKSFSEESLRNIVLDLILVPPPLGPGQTAGSYDQTDLAGKFSLLLWDTDLDLAGYYSSRRPSQIGLDLSRNLWSNLEIHGEYSRFDRLPKTVIARGTAETTEQTGDVYLLGLRWLSAWNLTVIAEYYHHDAGLTREEYQAYGQFLQAAVDAGNTTTALSFSKDHFGAATLMRQYLYLKLSWAEPFNWLYFTPALQVIGNLEDGSASIGLPISYRPVTNLDLWFWPAWFTGGKDTEFGDKPITFKLEMWARFYF